MKDTDIDPLIEGLKNIDMRLPLHQRTLRGRLLQMHTIRAGLARRRSASGTILCLRPSTTPRKMIVAGAMAFVLGVMLWGLAVLLSASNGSPGGKAIAKTIIVRPTAGQMLISDALCESVTACKRDNRNSQDPSAVTEPNNRVDQPAVAPPKKTTRHAPPNPQVAVASSPAQVTSSKPEAPSKDKNSSPSTPVVKLGASSLLKPALHSAAPEAQYKDGDTPIVKKKDKPSKADEAHAPNKEKDEAATQKPVFAQTAD